MYFSIERALMLNAL